MLGLMVGIIMIVIIVMVVLSLINQKERYSSSSLANIGSIGDYKIHPPEAINNFVGYDNMTQYGTYYNPFFPYVSGMSEHYERLQPRERFTASYDDTPTQGQYDEVYRAPEEAELPSSRSSNEVQTIQRLDRIDKNLLPRVSKNVTPYNIDVADPVTYTYQIHAPRVIRKDRLALEADPVRGDIPISIYPDVPIIQRSQFNRDSLRLDGTFSEALAKTYDRLTGKTYFNTPIHLSHGGMLM